MILDVQPNHLRPTNLDQTVAGGVRLSTEQGRTLGLRNEQTVRGVVDATGTSITLSTDYASQSLVLHARGQPFAELFFRSWLTPRGFILKPLANTAASAKDSSTTSFPATMPAPPPTTALPPRAAYLYLMQAPLSALSAFAQPQALRQLITQSVDTQAQHADTDTLWQSRQHLGAASIKSALHSSGVLGSGNAASLVTLKIMLEQIKKRIEDTQLRQFNIEADDIADAIDYLDSAQLQNVVKQDSQEILYRFPVLFNDSPPAEVIIHQDQHRQAVDTEPPWRFDLNIPIQGKQMLEVSAQLTQQASLNVVIWSQSEPLVRIMEREVVTLARQLSSWDISLAHCQIVLGQRPIATPTGDGQARHPGSQLDCYT
jgi:hypothetical protein